MLAVPLLSPVQEELHTLHPNVGSNLGCTIKAGQPLIFLASFWTERGLLFYEGTWQSIGFLGHFWTCLIHLTQRVNFESPKFFDTIRGANLRRSLLRCRYNTNMTEFF